MATKEEEQQQAREAVRPSTTVVTSENLAEHHAKKLGLEAPEPKPEPKADGKGEGEEAKKAAANADEAALEEELKTTQDPKKQRLNKRFSELTSQRNVAANERDAARAEAEREKQARLAAERERDELKKGAEGDKAKGQPPAEATAKPDRAKFPAGAEGDAAFQDALDDWRIDQKLADRERKQAEARMSSEQKEVIKSWQTNQTAARAVIPDYDAVINASAAVLSDEVRDAVISMDGEAGPRCLYYFAQFPQEAERIGKLTVGSALRELGKIEAKVMANVKQKADAGKKDEKKGDAEVSKAPKPADPLKSTSGPDEVQDEKGNLAPGISYKQYKQLRKEGKIT